MKFKKNLKGFTLIELIIAMCMFGILMLMVISISKPLGSLLSDSKQFTNQRSVAEGISNYICENVRYSGMVKVFQNCMPDSTIDNTYDVIRICDTDADTWSGINYTGRVRIQRGTYSSTVVWNTATDAMGKAYYGREFYTFQVNATTDGFSVTTTTYDKANDGSGNLIRGNQITEATASVSTLNITTQFINSTTPEPGVTYIAYKD